MKVIPVNFSAVTEHSLHALEALKEAIEGGHVIAFTCAIYFRDDNAMVTQDGHPAHVGWLLEMAKQDLLDENLRE